MVLTAPDYAFVTLYTVAKLAIAFTLTRIFGIILKFNDNYDLYISTSNLSIASLLNFESNASLFKKHRSAALIPIITIIFVFTAEGYPTLITRFTPIARITKVVGGLNLTTNSSALYFVLANRGIHNLNGKPGITVGVPRTPNESLIWADLGGFQQYCTFLNDTTYRAPEQFHNKLPDAMAAVTENDTKDNVKSIRPNPYYIKLVNSNASDNHKYMTINDQILKRDSSDLESVDENVFLLPWKQDTIAREETKYTEWNYDNENDPLIVPPTKWYS